MSETDRPDPAPESTAPYGSGPATAAASAAAAAPRKRVRVHHLRAMKERGEHFAMLTSYDQLTAEIFDQAGIPVLLVGDSAANNVLGYETTLPVTVDELLPLVRAVTRGSRSALVVADLPFGSYQSSPEQALATSVRFMKEGGAHAVKLEGGGTVVPQVAAIVAAGIPVMAHIGFTPQSEHGLGGYRVQGRGDAGDDLVRGALALQRAGAFAIVLEMVPGDVAKRVTAELSIPTIGIGAGVDCDGQVLVWQDMAGLRSGPMPRFVKRYADLRGTLSAAAAAFAADVADLAYLPLARRAAVTAPLRAAWADGLRTGLGAARPAGRQRVGGADPRVRGHTAPVDDAGWSAARRDSGRGALASRCAPRRRVEAGRPARAVADLGAVVPTTGCTAALVGHDGAARGRPEGRDRLRRRTRRRTRAAARTRRGRTTCRSDHPVDRRRGRRPRFARARPHRGAAREQRARRRAVDAYLARHRHGATSGEHCGR
jgi:3-methyl-2-oxobutanoate hydroxymethyltransferase